MSFDPGKRKERMAVGQAIEYWFTQLEWMRQSRTKMIKGFVGTNYGKTLGFGRVTPKAMLPLLQMTGQAYSVALAFHSPRFKLTSHESAGRAFAARWNAALNRRTESLQLEKMLRKCAIDAFFLMTIVKTYRGERPVDRVSPDDFVFDAGMTDIRRSPFFADRYRVPLEWCRANPAMDQSIVKTWKPVKRSEKTDDSSEAWHLTEGGDSDEGEYQEMVELSDVYFGDSSHVGTWPVSGNFELDMERKPALWLPWRQNDYGPYRIATFIDAPDNAVPVSPAAGIFDMYAFVNRLLTKVAYRSVNQKDILGYKAGGERDAQRAKNASEIDLVQMNDPDGLKLHKMLGVDQPLWSLTLSMLELYKQVSGNLDAMMGLNPVADTLGQSEQIMSRVAQREGEFKSRWVQFVSEIGEDIADDMIDNPDLSIKAQMQVGATDIYVDASWHPPDVLPRTGSIDTVGVRVEPQSMEFQSNQHKLMGMLESIGAMAPYMQVAAEQGTTLNFRKVVEKIGELRNDPDFVTLWDYNGVPLDKAQDAESRKFDDGKPKEYIRTSVSASNPGGSSGRLQTLAGEMSAATAQG